MNGQIFELAYNRNARKAQRWTWRPVRLNRHNWVAVYAPDGSLAQLMLPNELDQAHQLVSQRNQAAVA